MTMRERTALLLVVVGVCAVLVAAGAYGGWRAAVAVAGGLMLVFGVLLGLDDSPTVQLAVEDDVDVEQAS